MMRQATIEWAYHLLHRSISEKGAVEVILRVHIVNDITAAVVSIDSTLNHRLKAHRQQRVRLKPLVLCGGWIGKSCMDAAGGRRHGEEVSA